MKESCTSTKADPASCNGCEAYPFTSPGTYSSGQEVQKQMNKPTCQEYTTVTQPPCYEPINPCQTCPWASTCKKSTWKPYIPYYPGTTPTAEPIWIWTTPFTVSCTYNFIG